MMKLIPLNQYPKEFAVPFLHGIPFVTELRITAPEQLEVLLEHAYFLEAAPGDVVLKAGSRGERFYFLLYGQMSIYAGNVADGVEVNRIAAGQSFGALSVICDVERIASVAVSVDCKGALLLSIDMRELGKLSDFSVFSLLTKLALFRGVVHSTRWQLELYKLDYPNHKLATQGVLVEEFDGKLGTLEELESLNRQIYQMTGVMSAWNKQLSTEEGRPVFRGGWI